jgi:hypothetical protein
MGHAADDRLHASLLGQPGAGYRSAQLCDRITALERNVTQRCEQLARRITRGETVSLIVDSTGLSFGWAGQLYEEKCGKKADRTPWRKMHLGIEADMNIHVIPITATEGAGSEGMDANRLRICQWSR